MKNRLYCSFIQADQYYIESVIEKITHNNYRVKDSRDGGTFHQIHPDNYDAFIAFVSDNGFIDITGDTYSYLTEAAQRKLPIIVVLMGANLDNLNVKIEEILQNYQHSQHIFLFCEHPDDENKLYELFAQIIATLSDWKVYATGNTGEGNVNDPIEPADESLPRWLLPAAGGGILLVMLIIAGVLLSQRDDPGPAVTPTTQVAVVTEEDATEPVIATDEVPPSPAVTTEVPPPASTTPPTDEPSPTPNILATQAAALPAATGNLLYIKGKLPHILNMNNQEITVMSRSPYEARAIAWLPGNDDIIAITTYTGSGNTPENGELWQLSRTFSGEQLGNIRTPEGRVSQIAYLNNTTSVYNLEQADGTHILVGQLIPNMDRQVFLTRQKQAIHDPVWVNTETIVFSMQDDTGSSLYRIPLAPDSNPQRLTSADGRDFSPAIASGTSRLYFIRDNGATRQIYSYNLDTGIETAHPLSDNEYNPQRLSVSPDGNYLAFIATREDATNIFVVDQYFVTVEQVTNDGDAKEDLAWGASS